MLLWFHAKPLSALLKEGVSSTLILSSNPRKLHQIKTWTSTDIGNVENTLNYKFFNHISKKVSFEVQFSFPD